jgi:hypothetical protein
MDNEIGIGWCIDEDEDIEEHEEFLPDDPGEYGEEDDDFDEYSDGWDDSFEEEE